MAEVKLTAYSPQGSTTGAHSRMQGGLLDMLGKPVRTLDDFVANPDGGPITVAGDKSLKNQLYTIPEITYTSYRNGKPEKVTLKNVPAKFTDTGTAFRGKIDKNGRPTRIDVPVGVNYSKKQTYAQDFSNAKLSVAHGFKGTTEITSAGKTVKASPIQIADVSLPSRNPGQTKKMSLAEFAGMPKMSKAEFEEARRAFENGEDESLGAFSAPASLNGAFGPAGAAIKNQVEKASLKNLAKAMSGAFENRNMKAYRGNFSSNPGSVTTHVIDPFDENRDDPVIDPKTGAMVAGPKSKAIATGTRLMDRRDPEWVKNQVNILNRERKYGTFVTPDGQVLSSPGSQMSKHVFRANSQNYGTSRAAASSLREVTPLSPGETYGFARVGQVMGKQGYGPDDVRGHNDAPGYGDKGQRHKTEGLPSQHGIAAGMALQRAYGDTLTPDRMLSLLGITQAYPNFVVDPYTGVSNAYGQPPAGYAPAAASLASLVMGAENPNSRPDPVESTVSEEDQRFAKSLANINFRKPTEEELGNQRSEGSAEATEQAVRGAFNAPDETDLPSGDVPYGNAPDEDMMPSGRDSIKGPSRRDAQIAAKQAARGAVSNVPSNSKTASPARTAAATPMPDSAFDVVEPSSIGPAAAGLASNISDPGAPPSSMVSEAARTGGFAPPSSMVSEAARNGGFAPPSSMMSEAARHGAFTAPSSMLSEAARFGNVPDVDPVSLETDPAFGIDPKDVYLSAPALSVMDLQGIVDTEFGPVTTDELAGKPQSPYTDLALPDASVFSMTAEDIMREDENAQTALGLTPGPEYSFPPTALEQAIAASMFSNLRDPYSNAPDEDMMPSGNMASPYSNAPDEDMLASGNMPSTYSNSPDEDMMPSGNMADRPVPFAVAVAAEEVLGMDLPDDITMGDLAAAAGFDPGLMTEIGQIAQSVQTQIDFTSPQTFDPMSAVSPLSQVSAMSPVDIAAMSAMAGGFTAPDAAPPSSMMSEAARFGNEPLDAPPSSMVSESARFGGFSPPSPNEDESSGGNSLDALARARAADEAAQIARASSSLGFANAIDAAATEAQRAGDIAADTPAPAGSGQAAVSRSVSSGLGGASGLGSVQSASNIGSTGNAISETTPDQSFAGGFEATDSPSLMDSVANGTLAAENSVADDFSIGNPNPDVAAFEGASAPSLDTQREASYSTGGTMSAPAGAFSAQSPSNAISGLGSASSAAASAADLASQIGTPSIADTVSTSTQAASPPGGFALDAPSMPSAPTPEQSAQIDSVAALDAHVARNMPEAAPAAQAQPAAQPISLGQQVAPAGATQPSQSSVPAPSRSAAPAQTHATPGLRSMEAAISSAVGNAASMMGMPSFAPVGQGFGFISPDERAYAAAAPAISFGSIQTNASPLGGFSGGNASSGSIGGVAGSSTAGAFGFDRDDNYGMGGGFGGFQ